MVDEAIKALQRQAEAGGQRFPGLSHILLVWEESGPSSKESIFERVLGLKIPQPAAGGRIVTTWPAETGNEAERLLCQVWQHGSAWQKSTGTHWAHFVFRGWAESWAKDKAIDALSNVAKLIGRFIRAEKPTNWPDSIERALLALHQYGPVDVYACQKLHKPVLAIPTIPLVNQFLTNAEFHYFGVVGDVWTGLNLLCARLLGLADSAPAEPKTSGGDSAPAQTDDKVDTEPIKPVTKALMLLHEHYDDQKWTNTKIAQEVGVSRTTLYSWPEYKKARAILRATKQELPRGFKNSETSEIESYETGSEVL